MKPRILLYSHDSYGLGHFRRITAVATELARRAGGADLLLVTGSPRPELFKLPAGADFIKLPSIWKDASGSYIPRSLGSDVNLALRIRSETLHSLGRSFDPHIILVDHAPLGVSGELLGFLKDRKERRPDVRLFLGMRDILDAPQAARRQMADPQIRAALEFLYDGILVYGHRHICDLAKEYAFSKTVARKTAYVGIACGFASADEQTAPSKTPVCRPSTTRLFGTGRWRDLRLAVTAGGGDDAAPFLSKVITCLSQPQVRVTSDILIGPLMPKSSQSRLHEMVENQEHIRITTATRTPQTLLTEADVVLARGGYNSVYESLYLNKPLLVFPRTHPRMEQAERATRLEKMGLLTVITDHDLSHPPDFWAKVASTAHRPHQEAQSRGLRFDGAEEAARVMLGGLEAQAATEQEIHQGGIT